MVDVLSIVKLVAYLVLAPVSLYCLIKHGKRGFLGWFYVGVLCALRIATGAIGIHGSNSGTVAVILNSIGLSPLLLACVGALHEVRRSCIPHSNAKTEWFMQIQYHALVASAMVLIVIAIVNLESGKNIMTMEILLKVGASVSALCWGILICWTAWSFASLKRLHGSNSNHRNVLHSGLSLLRGIFIASPFIGVRLAYAIATLLLRITHPSSGFLTSTAVQVCLNFLPEVLATVILLVFGVMTRHIKSDSRELARTLREGNGSLENITSGSNDPRKQGN